MRSLVLRAIAYLFDFLLFFAAMYLAGKIVRSLFGMLERRPHRFRAVEFIRPNRRLSSND